MTTWERARPERMPQHFAREAMLVGLRPPDRFRFTHIEIGCGRGATLRVLAAACPKATVVGVEGDGRQDGWGLENLSFLSADAALPTADSIYVSGAHRFPALETLIERAAHALRPGGVLMLESELAPGRHHMAPLREAAATLRAYGADPLATLSILLKSDEAFARLPAVEATMQAWERVSADEAAAALDMPPPLPGVGTLILAAERAGLRVCGPLFAPTPAGEAFSATFAPGVPDLAAREGIASLAKGEPFRTLVCAKPDPDAKEGGGLLVTGADIVGFDRPARWADEVSDPGEALSDQFDLADRAIAVEPVLQAVMDGRAPKTDLEVVTHRVGEALRRRTGVTWGGPPHDPEPQPQLSHPIAGRLLADPAAARYGVVLPASALAGGVSLPPGMAALTAAYVDGAEDLVAAARKWLERAADAPPFARPPAVPVAQDPSYDVGTFEDRWLPFLAMAGVLAPAATP